MTKTLRNAAFAAALMAGVYTVATAQQPAVQPAQPPATNDTAALPHPAAVR
jgi:hypothetical protein